MNEPSPWCVYDNPSTMAREFWVSGQKRIWITSEFILYGAYWQSAVPEVMHQATFEPGLLKGDVRAMPFEYRPKP